MTERYTGLGSDGALTSMPMTSGTAFPDTAFDPSHRSTVLLLDESGGAGLALALPRGEPRSGQGLEASASAGGLSRRGTLPRVRETGDMRFRGSVVFWVDVTDLDQAAQVVQAAQQAAYEALGSTAIDDPDSGAVSDISTSPSPRLPAPHSTRRTSATGSAEGLSATSASVLLIDGRGSGARLDRASADARISSLASARVERGDDRIQGARRIDGRASSLIFGGSTTR